MPPSRTCLTLTNRGDELKAALEALGDRVIHHDTGQPYLQVFVDTVVVTISDRDLADLQARFQDLHVEEAYANVPSPPNAEGPDMNQKWTLSLVGRGDELKAALEALGPRVTIHAFSAFVGTGEVTIGDTDLADLRTRFPALEALPCAGHPPSG